MDERCSTGFFGDRAAPLGGGLLTSDRPPTRAAAAAADSGADEQRRQWPVEAIEIAVDGLGRDAARHLPSRTRALVTGRPGAPLLVVLGGISATAAVVSGQDGSPGWWSRLFGTGRSIDPADYRILGIDFLADDEGRFAPSTHDQAAIIAAVLGQLGEQAHAIIGASYGGMVALAWAERYRVTGTRLALVSANAAPHPMASAARSLQRRVVGLGLAKGCAAEALSIARGMAMLTYRTAEEFGERFTGGIADGDPLGPTSPGDYLEARGRSFVAAMPPGRFLSLSGSIDRHSIDPAAIANPALIVGVEDDLLVPPEQCVELADKLAGPARIELVRSIYGHDAFLKEERIGALIANFLGARQ